MWPLACGGPPASGNRWSPGHVAIEEIRGGAGSGGGDLLGLLLLFPLAANVAQGAERLSLETPRLPLTSWHPWNKTKQKQEGLPLPSSSTCCTQLYRQPLPNRLLRKILHVELQEADGDCHLQAIVLHLPRRTVCVHPQNGSLARWFERHGKSLQGTLSNLNLELQMKMYSSPQQQN
ncbi:C-C motif chemokine 27 isoform X3 [Microtus ochrogaster]|uniref:C-C motif chemokine 27 isoform X3 n=1 Tax=Microtus ochrogaster TaxID=79684 RepID=A0ABM1UKM7_MICOH|nr:C-C motif chemokine 27 isoform X3 [Microtus ochrogaster]